MSERPHRCRTWAPRGQTPVLQYHFNWHTLSAMAGVTWWNFYFRLFPGTIRSPQVIEFLEHLLRHIPGKLLVVWDGLTGHRSHLTWDFIRQQRGRLWVEFLPGYAPELNPVEYLWSHEQFEAYRPPDLEDKTPATEEELQSLAQLVNEHILLWFRDIRDGGSVWCPVGGGPFAVDDAITARNSWALCGLMAGITFLDWLPMRKKLWLLRTPWTEGLSNLFGAVQEELLSQWRVLPADSLVHQLALKERSSSFEQLAVPAQKGSLRLERGKDCEELAEEIRTIRHKRKHGGLTMAEIQTDCPFFKIWKRVDVLSDEDKDTFRHPGTWETGYTNLLLGKLYATARRNIASGTVNTWRKEYRAYLKWQQKNPSKTSDDFSLEIQRRKRGYRKPRPAK